MACLDYVPSVAIRPVDMTEKLRPKKALRKIRLLIGACSRGRRAPAHRAGGVTTAQRRLLGRPRSLTALAKAVGALASAPTSDAMTSVLLD
jgi:hypothetical protein